MPDRSLLVDQLTRFARQLVDDYTISDALHDLVDATTAILGIRGAGTSLGHDGRLAFATAVPEDITAVEQVQERDQEGPCVEAFRTGRPVLVTDLTIESERWPEIAAAAAAVGISSVAAIPLCLDGTCLGALDLYRTEAHAWTEEEVETAALLAAMAAGYLANASRLDRAEQTAAQLQEALDSRVVIEQAKGILAGERGISVDVAFTVLRGYARSRRAPLREVANAVVRLGLRP